MDLFDAGAYIEPLKEVEAYEALWCAVKDPTFKRVSEQLQSKQPSAVVWGLDPACRQKARDEFRKLDITTFGLMIRGTSSYPKQLLDLTHPIEILYYRGNPNLLHMPAVSVVGARAVSERGADAAGRIARGLVSDGYVVVSGLAEGTDTAAHRGAIDAGGQTIAVIGTPITEVYPRKNTELQKLIESNYLLLSQVPFLRYRSQSWKINRFFFPERNKTMAALTEATVIVEASDKSGTLTQARECLRLNKKLIILKPTVKNPQITWPKKFVAKGAFVVETYSDIRKILRV